jgi:collagen beta-1,O-galactosyltransferase
MVPVDEYLPIMYDRHPRNEWKQFYRNRNLKAFSVHPLFIYPTHYIGEEGYLSDTEDSVVMSAPSCGKHCQLNVQKDEL